MSTSQITRMLSANAFLTSVLSGSGLSVRPKTHQLPSLPPKKNENVQILNIRNRRVRARNPSGDLRDELCRQALRQLVRQGRTPDRDAEDVSEAADEDEEGEGVAGEGWGERCEDCEGGFQFVRSGGEVWWERTWENSGGVEESDADREGDGPGRKKKR